MSSEHRLARTTVSDHPDDPATARLPDPDDEALLVHVDRLRRRERMPSARRTMLLGHLDRLQAALVGRNRDVRAAIDVAFTLDSS